MNQKIARLADRVVLIVAGIAITVKGEGSDMESGFADESEGRFNRTVGKKVSISRRCFL